MSEARQILLIDDDRLQWRIVEQQLRAVDRTGFALTCACTYEEGLERLTSNGFAACLLDYQLGERDGLQLLREAVAAECRTPIIFLTAESSSSVDIKAMNAGALDYLEKRELTPRALGRALRYALKVGETMEALRRLATHDELTGLLNRREFTRVLREEEERARRFDRPFGLVLIDIDHFKAVNDTHGHAAGDAVLREVARRIAGRVRAVDRCARIGGEELAVLLPEADANGALAVANDLLAAVATAPFAVNGGAMLDLTVSAGAASLPAHAREATHLMEAADRALYRAKRAGRARAMPAESA